MLSAAQEFGQRVYQQGTEKTEDNKTEDADYEVVN